MDEAINGAVEAVRSAYMGLRDAQHMMDELDKSRQTAGERLEDADKTYRTARQALLDLVLPDLAAERSQYSVGGIDAMGRTYRGILNGRMHNSTLPQEYASQLQSAQSPDT